MSPDETPETPPTPEPETPEAEASEPEATEAEAAPRRRRRSRKKADEPAEVAAEAAPDADEDELDETPEDVEAEEAAADVMLEADAEAEGEAEAEAPAPARRRRRRATADEPEAEAEEDEGQEPPSPAPTRRRRRGEWDPDLPPPVVRAQAKYVRSSARKARLVCDHIRGKSVVEARAILAHTSRAVARDWSKLLESAVANAENNHELVGEDLYVVEIHADEGPTIRRFRPRAMGRATRIRKRTSHLTILLTPKD